MLLNLKEILEIAEKGCFAIPAFNVYNMETVIGVMQAAEELKAPVILQGYSRLFQNDDAYYLSPVILNAAKKSSLPICFHLDHGSEMLQIIRGIRYGCTGIMIDGSKLPLEENISLTKQVVDVCTAASIPVEGELGHIGTTNEIDSLKHTDVNEAKQFVQETGVSALAVMVGTAHGRYKKSPEINIQRISDIKRETGIPLVLHGGSGVPDEQIIASIKAGIRKINFATDLCYAFIDTIFETPRDKVAIDLFMKQPIESVKKFALEKIKLVMADGKA
jgi:ketose-bisphosphate aldolase